MSYPLPSYATTIWVSGDKLYFTIPATKGDKSHCLTLPATEVGMKVALDLLRERAQEGYEPTIGTKAAPVQYDIDAILRKMGGLTGRVPTGASGLPEVQKLPPKQKRDAQPTLSLADLGDLE